ncbi:MFS transporter [Bacillus sp. FJAT-47783]|uniref:MFS transporter n=1 Tax=Bacillus sp. FJAT-47783 TaxID=2922712 RepID=UPI001FADC902|nr:MFS transporter [Bacillus sp. FJAT-47783]
MKRFRNKNSYKPFLISSFFSRFGEWMDFTVLNWVILEATKSPAAIGVLNACRLIPIFLFSLLGGILSDRYSNKKILQWSQIGLSLLTATFIFIYNAHFSFFLLVVIVFLRSVILAVETPVRNTFIASLTEKKQLASAISMHTSIIHISRLIGPALAGFLLVSVHENVLFIIYIVLLLLSAVCLIRLPEGIGQKKTKTAKKSSMKEVFSFIKQDRPLQGLLFLSIVPMLFGFPYSSLLPIFVQQLMNLGPDQFGVMLSFSSVGAFLSTVIMSMNWIKVTATKMIGACLLFSFMLMIFIVSSSHVLVVWCLLFFIGFFGQAYRTSNRILLQYYVPDEMRGRVLSIALMDRGFISLGVLLFSFIAEWSVYGSGILMGMCCFIFSLIIFVLNRDAFAGLSKGEEDDTRGEVIRRRHHFKIEKTT